MSFYNSLNQLWIKIQQKNIVLVSGNIDEIIPVDSELFKNILSKKEININGFTNILKFLEIKTDEIDNKDFISYYSPNTGNIVNGKLKENENNSNDDEFSSFNDENSLTGLISLKEYLNWMNSEIKNLKNDKTKSKSKYFVINFADIFMNDRVSDLSTTEFSQILESLIDQVNTNASKFKNDNIKLIIISHNPNIVSTFITNNTEFASVTILKPDKNEREDFLKRYSTRFQNLKNTLSNIDHPDFKEAIAISNGLSFREIFQLSKLDTNSFANKELSFAELYKLATFFKKDSEWEKIDPSKLKDIETILRKRVKGQENAIQKVKNTLIRSFVGMNGILHSIDNSKPKGTLFFAGPTGTGKTELSKSIAEFIFGDEKRIIRFDMSEFNHEHSDQRLIGAPPGYVGYDAGGELTNKVKENPFSVLLFDEIEKAHNKILDKFLQILEDGRLTSSQGEIIDFSQTFIIFTSNIGANKVNVNSSFMVF